MPFVSNGRLTKLENVEKMYDLDKKIVENLEHSHAIEVSSLKHANKMELEEKEFELKHLADNRVQKLEAEKVALQQEVAVLKGKVEMFEKVVDINGDIVDVKDLMNRLIEALPKINISNMTFGSGQKDEKAK